MASTVFKPLVATHQPIVQIDLNPYNWTQEFTRQTTELKA